MEENNIKKILKFDMKKIVLGIIFLLFFILCLISVFKNVNSKNIVDLHNVKGSNYAIKIEISSIPVLIAEPNICQDNEECQSDLPKLYIGVDTDKYLYIAYLTDETYNEIKKEDNISVNKLTLYGISTSFDSSVKSVAKEGYNNIAEKEVINDENFNNYFGKYYLDSVSNKNDIEYQRPVPTYSLILVSILFFLAGSGSIYNALSNYKKSKNLINSLSDNKLKTINKELKSDNTINYSKNKIYLTENYIIDYNNILKIIKYSDIIWFYKFKSRDYIFLTSKKSIMIYDKECDRYNVATGLKFNNTKKYSNIYKKIKEKSVKAIEGYTDENIEKFTKIVKK